MVEFIVLGAVRDHAPQRDEFHSMDGNTPDDGPEHWKLGIQPMTIGAAGVWVRCDDGCVLDSASAAVPLQSRSAASPEIVSLYSQFIHRQTLHNRAAPSDRWRRRRRRAARAAQ